MTSRQNLNKSPSIDSTAYIDCAAQVIGDVTIAANASIWPMAVVRGDMHSICIGKNTNIQDGAILHVTHDSRFYPGGYALSIGDNVTVGHNVVVHGCTIEDYCLIGIGSIILDGAHIQKQVILGAGSLVTPGTVLDSGHLWLGSPARKIRKLSDDELEFLDYSAKNYVELKNQYMAGQNQCQD